MKSALPFESPILSSGTNHVSPMENHMLSKNTGEVSPMEQVHQFVALESTDGVTSMETSYEQVAEESQSQDESDAGTKKRRVEEESSADGNVNVDYSLQEPREEQLKDSGDAGGAVSRDFQGATNVAGNSSIAERVIEPTLVMFEVILLAN